MRTARRGLDWLKLRDFRAGQSTGGDLIEMVVYAGLPPAIAVWQDEAGQEKQVRPLAALQRVLVVSKDGAPARRSSHYKANVDVMMAIDALELSMEIRPDVVILVTGDADFGYLPSNCVDTGSAWKSRLLHRPLNTTPTIRF